MADSASVAYTPQGDSRYVIVASNGGSPTHPSWYYNVKANRRIEVEVGTETFTVLAEELPLRGAQPEERQAVLIHEVAAILAYPDREGRFLGRRTRRHGH